VGSWSFNVGMLAVVVGLPAGAAWLSNRMRGRRGFTDDQKFTLVLAALAYGVGAWLAAILKYGLRLK
jgi:hypothetical protein